jgi:hypothetical protein
LISTGLICFIGLNWEERKDETQIVTRLKVPQIEPVSFSGEKGSRPVMESETKVISLDEDEVSQDKDTDPEKIYPGALDDEGNTIILE